MHRFFEALRPFIRGVIQRAGWVLALATLLSIVSISLAINLRIDTDLANLIPQDYPSVQALERLRETVEGALDDAEQRTQELRSRAKKMRGDAKKRLEEQAHEVEQRQHELRERLEELKSEASRLLERSRS